MPIGTQANAFLAPNTNSTTRSVTRYSRFGGAPRKSVAGSPPENWLLGRSGVIGKTRWIEIQALWSRVDRDWRRLAQSKVIRRLKIRLLLLDLARCRLTGDDVGIVDNLIDLGRFMGDDGQLDASERAFLEARHRAVTKDYELAIARTGIGLAAIAVVRQNHDLAVKLLEGELPRTRRIP